MVPGLWLACLCAFAPPVDHDAPPLQRPRKTGPEPVESPAPSATVDEPSAPGLEEGAPSLVGQVSPEPAAPSPAGPSPATTLADELPTPESGPRHGFAYEPSAGYSTGFMGPAINPSAHFGLVLGGSLRRRGGPWGGQQLAVGALVHVEFPVVIHRHHLAIVGLAGAKNRLYWRVSAGLTGHYDAAGAGVGAALGFAIPFPATRVMAMTVALTCFADWASVAMVAPGVALSVVRF